MTEINFDELENKAKENIKINNQLKQEEIKKAEEEESKGITAGWTKGPFIVGGVIALILILISVWVMFFM